MKHIPGLYMAYNEKGRGMYTAEAISKGSIIENCPLIILPEDERSIIHQSTLHDYYFIWPMGGIAIALGYGSLYNHSDTPNAKVIFDLDEKEMVLEALQEINPGDEILIDYTDGTEETKLWF